MIATTVIAGGMTIITIKYAFAQGDEKKFTAKLSGKDEVPSKDIKATGTAEFTLSRDGKTMTYKVDIKDIDKITMAHIHQGKLGENDPVVVTLFKVATPPGPKNGLLAQGSIISDKLEGPLKGKQISERNPKGEIRGQISK